MQSQNHGLIADKKKKSEIIIKRMGKFIAKSKSWTNVTSIDNEWNNLSAVYDHVKNAGENHLEKSLSTTGHHSSKSYQLPDTKF